MPLCFAATAVQISKRSSDTAEYDSISFINAIGDICIFPYKYRFCGLPMGVSILPKFAAIVCNTTTGTASFRTASSPDRRSTVNVKGTKVINATSFVINMLKKKHSNTRISVSAITLWVCCNNILATLRNMPSFCNPAITVIRQNKIASVRKSIYPIYSLSGGIITADNTASTIAAVSTVSFFTNSMILFFIFIVLSLRHPPRRISQKFFTGI